MEREIRKRKLEDEEENEEQKMEEFFALIKSTKDLLSNKEKTTDNKDEGKKEKGIWNPTFQLEDFIGCGELGKRSVSVTVTHDHAAGPSEKEKGVIIEKENLQEETTAAAAEAPAEETEEKEKASDLLDLNLSL